MNAKITVTLHPNEKNALIMLAKHEERDPRAQAALIIRKELERLGYLKVDPETQQDEKKDNSWLIS